MVKKELQSKPKLSNLELYQPSITTKTDYSVAQGHSATLTLNKVPPSSDLKLALISAQKRELPGKEGAAFESRELGKLKAEADASKVELRTAWLEMGEKAAQIAYSAGKSAGGLPVMIVGKLTGAQKEEFTTSELVMGTIATVTLTASTTYAIVKEGAQAAMPTFYGVVRSIAPAAETPVMAAEGASSVLSAGQGVKGALKAAEALPKVAEAPQVAGMAAKEGTKASVTLTPAPAKTIEEINELAKGGLSSPAETAKLREIFEFTRDNMEIGFKDPATKESFKFFINKPYFEGLRQLGGKEAELVADVTASYSRGTYELVGAQEGNVCAGVQGKIVTLRLTTDIGEKLLLTGSRVGNEIRMIGPPIEELVLAIR